MQKHNISSHVHTYRQLWQKYFGDFLGCSEVNNSLLWWLPTEEDPEREPNFNNYKQIGGWKIPYLKQLDLETICGVILLQNYYE